MNLKIYPIAYGNHENVHFIVRDKNKIIVFKVVGFLNTNDAYIVKCNNKIHTDLLNHNQIYDDVSNALKSKDFNLKTKIENLFSNFENTESIIIYYKL